jgi:NAD(P)-dependent dehydrogenase (short-subunit alcohol dehydrogenase family)
MNFSGKYAVVTGGGSGIGAATARLLGEHGAGICITGRRKDKLEETVRALKNIGIDATAFPCDVSRADSVRSFTSHISKTTDVVHMLVNNAGVYLQSAIWEMTEPDWDITFGTNVKAVYLLVKMLMPMMKDHDSAVVNVASTLAYQTSRDTAAYAASKAAVLSLTRSLARELGVFKIRVNCVCPGIVDTPAHDAYFGESGEKESFFAEVSKTLPLGRIGTPEDVARATAFLLSEEASWITGTVLAVDGGISLL